MGLILALFLTNHKHEHITHLLVRCAPTRQSCQLPYTARGGRRRGHVGFSPKVRHQSQQCGGVMGRAVQTAAQVLKFLNLDLHDLNKLAANTLHLRL